MESPPAKLLLPPSVSVPGPALTMAPVLVIALLRVTRLLEIVSVFESVPLLTSGPLNRMSPEPGTPNCIAAVRMSLFVTLRALASDVSTTPLATRLLFKLRLLVPSAASLPRTMVPRLWVVTPE